MAINVKVVAWRWENSAGDLMSYSVKCKGVPSRRTQMTLVGDFLWLRSVLWGLFSTGWVTSSLYTPEEAIYAVLSKAILHCSKSGIQ